MKNFKMLRCVMIVAMVTLLAVGCAKTPKEDMSTKTPVATETQTTDSDMTETAIMETPAVESTMATISDLSRIHFAFDSYVLSNEARSILKQNATVLRATPSLKVTVEGHCDERGSDDYNLALGEERAQAAVDYLASLGVPASQMTAVSMGELDPLVQGHNEEAWEKNRRAEFKAR